MGGYIAMYTEGSTSFVRRDSEWGTRSGTIMIVGKGYCWDSQSNRRRYCQQKLYLYYTDNPTTRHYDFKGSYLVKMDSRSKKEDKITFKNMIYHAEPPFIDVIVFHGESWSPEFNSWGYAYLHYILEPSVTRIPIADAFSWKPVSKADSGQNEPENQVGNWFLTSRKRQLSDFRCHSPSWGSQTTCNQYIWTALTEVVNYKYNASEARIISSQPDVTVDGIVLENDGLGVGGNDLARVGSKETISTTSSATFSSGFSVGVDRSVSFGFEIGGKSSSIGSSTSTSMGADFTFQNDITKTETSISSKEISWPSECPPGIRKTVRLIEQIQKLSVPVEFTLKRAGATWTEEKDLIVTLKSIVIHSSECCLHIAADDDCGSEYLQMCSGESLSHTSNTNPPIVTNDD